MIGNVKPDIHEMIKSSMKKLNIMFINNVINVTQIFK